MTPSMIVTAALTKDVSPRMEAGQQTTGVWNVCGTVPGEEMIMLAQPAS